MSDVFKWIFATILLYKLTTSTMLMAQDTPSTENASAQQPETILPDTFQKPPQITESGAAQWTGIYLELPADPALVETFRRLAEALSVKYKIQIQDAGTSASGPEFIEAELRLKQNVELDKVEKIFGTLVRCGVSRVRLSGRFAGQNMVVINAPANASWKLIHDMETFLAKLDGFKFDVRVRDHDLPPTATNSDVALPELTPDKLTSRTQSETGVRASTPGNSMSESQLQEIREKITQLESERAELSSKLVGDHPNLHKLDDHIAALRNSVKGSSQNPITVYYLRHAKANQAAGMIQLLYPGRAEAIVADERSNSLFIRADEKQIREIEKYIEILDQDVSPTSNALVSTVTADEVQLKIVHLQHSDANQTAAVIEQLFGGANVTVAVDARTNSLIVRSNETLLMQIEAILLRLDEQPGKQAPIVSSTTGTAANSTITVTPDPTATSEPRIVPIAEYRGRLNELELPLLQLAEKVRSTEASLGKDHPDSLKQRASLRETIQKTFATRQEIQRAELTEFTRRLQRMQQSIDSRDLILDKIVDRRLEELLNPDTSWDGHLGRSDGSLHRRNAAEPKLLQGARAVSGLVQSVSGMEVRISLGIDDGIRPRDKLAVLSGLDYDSANVIEITSVQQDCSLARILTEAEEFRIRSGDPVLPITSGKSDSERTPEPAVVTSAEENAFPPPAWRPKSEAEKATSRLVLVFFQDKARRAVPALLIRHGNETIALTTGPATIVPENIEHAIDRTFLEFYDRENVPTTYADFSTPDLFLHVAKEQLTSFQLKNPVTLKTGDVLSAILMHGQADLEVTADAARITAVDQRTTWQLPSHNLNREFTGLFQIDKRLPEGTPLFKNGELAGITLLGTRFMKDDFPGSYVVSASRIVEVLQQLKIE